VEKFKGGVAVGHVGRVGRSFEGAPSREKRVCVAVGKCLASALDKSKEHAPGTGVSPTAQAPGSPIEPSGNFPLHRATGTF